MAQRKKVEGLPFAIRSVVYGLPPSLTAEQELYLDLNVEEARCVQVLNVAQGISLANGGVGPKGYYRLITGGDEEAAKRSYYDALLRGAM